MDHRPTSAYSVSSECAEAAPINSALTLNISRRKRSDASRLCTESLQNQTSTLWRSASPEYDLSIRPVPECAAPRFGRLVARDTSGQALGHFYFGDNSQQALEIGSEARRARRAP